MIDMDKINDCLMLSMVSPVARNIIDKAFTAIAIFQNGHMMDETTHELLKEPGVVMENREDILEMFLDSMHREIFPNQSIQTDKNR